MKVAMKSRVETLWPKRVAALVAHLPGIALTGLFVLAFTVSAMAASSHPQRAMSSAAATADPLVPGGANVKALPPDIRIPTYRPGPIPFRDGERLYYSASWLGIPAATAEIVLHHNPRDPSLWTAEAWIRTNRAVDLVYKMRDYLREDFHVSTLAPDTMEVRQNEGRRHDRFVVRFNQAKQLVTMRKWGPRGLQIRRFRAAQPWGMASGAAMALSQPLTAGNAFVFDVFSATSRYVLDFAVTSHAHLNTQAGSFAAVKIEPSVVWMSDKSMREWARATTVWISDDTRRLPLRIEAAIFIGDVRIDLVKVEEPGTSLPAGSEAPG
jgi:hypothetical protein